MALVVVTGILLARSLVGPIERLVEVTRAVAAGDLGRRSGVRRGDEIGQLAEAFDQMTASLADYTGRLEEMYLNTVHSLAMALDARDPYTHGHSARVADYAVRTAHQLGLADSEIAQLRIGAYLHDVGKIGVADAILQKPGRLTDEEREIMRRHPEVGAQILQPVGFNQSVMDVVLHHHERLDGEGFPWGLAGDEIPLLARVVAVADAYDAMTTNRAYRAAMTPEQAYAELARAAGSQFDPRVVEAFGVAQQLGTGSDAEAPPEPVASASRGSMLGVLSS
jgi:putative nucleotidyltransferase with HDIG domain